MKNGRKAMRCKPAAVSRRVRCDKEWLRTRLQEEVEDICAEFAADEERRQQERRDAEWHDVAVAQEGGREGMGLSAPSLAKLESSKRLFLRWAEQHADKVMIDPPLRWGTLCVVSSSTMASTTTSNAGYNHLHTYLLIITGPSNEVSWGCAGKLSLDKSP